MLDLPHHLFSSVYKAGTWEWRIQGRSPGGRVPLFLTRRAEKSFFETGPPLIWRSGSATTWRKRKQIITESRHFVFYVTFKSNISWYVKGNAVYFLPGAGLGIETSSNCRGFGIPNENKKSLLLFLYTRYRAATPDHNVWDAYVFIAIGYRKTLLWVPKLKNNNNG